MSSQPVRPSLTGGVRPISVDLGAGAYAGQAGMVVRHSPSAQSLQTADPVGLTGLYDSAHYTYKICHCVIYIVASSKACY